MAAYLPPGCILTSWLHTHLRCGRSVAVVRDFLIGPTYPTPKEDVRIDDDESFIETLTRQSSTHDKAKAGSPRDFLKYVSWLHSAVNLTSVHVHVLLGAAAYWRVPEDHETHGRRVSIWRNQSEGCMLYEDVRIVLSRPGTLRALAGVRLVRLPTPAAGTPPHPATAQYSEHSVYIPAAATSAQHTEVEHLRAQEDVFSEVHDHEDLGATLSCPL